jgi:hypothetical protein
LGIQMSVLASFMLFAQMISVLDLEYVSKMYC